MRANYTANGGKRQLKKFTKNTTMIRNKNVIRTNKILFKPKVKEGSVCVCCYVRVQTHSG